MFFISTFGFRNSTASQCGKGEKRGCKRTEQLTGRLAGAKLLRGASPVDPINAICIFMLHQPLLAAVSLDPDA